MLIERKSIIAFDENQERERIRLLFAGNLRAKLLAVLDAFVATDWSTALQLVRDLDKPQREFLNATIQDVLSEIARREDVIEAARQRAQAEGRHLSYQAERVLGHPLFSAMSPSLVQSQPRADASSREKPIFVPRVSVGMLLAGPRARHSINVVVPYRGFNISIVAASVDTKSDLRASTVRVYYDGHDRTEEVFGVADSTNVDATASTLQQAFEAIDKLLAIPDIPVMEQMG